MSHHQFSGIAVLLWVWQVAASPLAAQSLNSAGERQPARIIVWLPAEAELEVLGQRMPGTGDRREFQSPPLVVGKEFTYPFKAAWQQGGERRTVEKQAAVQADETTEVQLYDFELTPAERELLHLVNRERARVGAPPLLPDGRLFQAAREHSANMARQKVLSHTLDGKSFSQRMQDLRYYSLEAGENCARHAQTPAEVMAMWMRSENHRANIHNPRYREIGVGVATSERGETFWTQVFAAPLDSDLLMPPTAAGH